MGKAMIDYGCGVAELIGDFAEENTERFFMTHANQCFGIRKSITDFKLLSFDSDGELSEFWKTVEGAKTFLKHSGGDTIVWDDAGEKIKSEWD